MPEFSKDEQKEIFQEALQDWLDKKYAEFGRWTFHGILAALLVALVIFLTGHGAKLENFLGR